MQTLNATPYPMKPMDWKNIPIIPVFVTPEHDGYIACYRAYFDKYQRESPINHKELKQLCGESLPLNVIVDLMVPGRH